MSHGQATGLFAMACWWGASWSAAYWPEVWWVPSLCQGIFAVGGGVFVYGWMLDQGGVKVEKIK
ncbi:hypothetical protein LCGC14_1895240 [marine sediment metagenome]|uniref:Uncharacterized protein n=1 Tax=marine sediment metagenome TaxID=412755 RepID=A0A0F9FYA0_9ZZZZ